MMVFAHLLSSLSIAASGTFLMCLESRTTQGDWLRARSAFRWVMRSRKFDRNGDDWEGEVVPAHDPDAEPRSFASREDLAALLAA